MSEQTHFLERTSRLEDLALQRAMTIYRDPNAREWLGRVAVIAGFPRDARIAVPLGPQPSPAYVVLDTKGDVVTCLAEGMVVTDSQALAWKQVEEVFTKLSSLSGGDPDPHWTWRRLWRVLIDSEGWLPREAYEILSRERLMMHQVLPTLLVEAFKLMIELCQESGDVLTLRLDRQPKETRAWAGQLLWYLRHLINLSGEVGVAKEEQLLPDLLHFHFGHIDVAAGVALGRIGPQTFDWMQRKYLAEKNPIERADYIRGIALATARQPSMAVAAGRLLKRMENEVEKAKDGADTVALQTSVIAVCYLAAQGGRVASEVVSIFNGKSDPSLVAWFAERWRVDCAELHERWPSGEWRPSDLYLPREESEAAHRKGPRPCPDPLELRAVSTIERTKTKVHRNDPCPCGSGKKAKKCCGTQGKYEERQAGDLPGPWEAERRAFIRAAKGMGDRLIAQAREDGVELPPLDQWE